MSLWENGNAVLDAMKSSSKLPNEQQIRDYFNQFIVSDPHSQPGMATWDTIIKNEMQRSPDPEDYDDDHNKSIDISGGWVANSFYCPELIPQHVPGNTSSMSWEEYTKDFPAQFKEAYVNSHSNARQTNQSSFTRGSQFARLQWHMKRGFDDYRELQLKVLVDTLKAKGFTRKRSDPELVHEIAVRKKQFPGQIIYCMTGREFTDYLHNIYGVRRWNNAVLVRPGGYSCIGDLGDYESAVFAHCQVRTSHRYLFHYGFERIPRRWRYRCCSLMEFSLEMDERIEDEEELIKIIPASLHRFSHIE